MTYVAEAARLPALIGQRAGSGPALLLLPGLGSTLTEFRAVLPSLIQRYDVLALSCLGKDGHPPFPPPFRRPSRPLPTPWSRSWIGGVSPCPTC
jgi:pimeloyl-ACP methyl ester carboxylesterase